MSKDPKWLALVQEDILDPEQPIIDPHHHLWDHPSSRYMLEELHGDTGAGHRVLKTVFIECLSGYRSCGPEALKPVGETEFVDAIAKRSDAGDGAVIAGIVGFADLCLGNAVDAVLRAHVASGQGRFKGVRHAVGWDKSEAIRNSHTNPIPNLLLNEQFRQGFARLAAYDLSFDAWLYHPQLPELVELARAFPRTTIVLDHFGGPLGIGPYRGRRESIFEQWQQHIAELAGCQNVVAKLGGLAMPVNGFEWHKRDRPPGSEALAESQAPWHHYLIEQFGAERCMFESNFPVDRASCSYTVLWNAFKRIARGYSPQQRQALFHDTARRVYRL